MKPTKITLTFKSAATFGNGNRFGEMVDYEIEQDEYGFPFLRGRALKGLLAESTANVAYALHQDSQRLDWFKVKNNLFGISSDVSEHGNLHIGDARLPSAIRSEVIAEGWTPEDVLYSLTSVRRHVSINEHGVSDNASLRSMRVLLSGTILEAKIFFEREPSESEKQLLAAAVLDFRHAGRVRNRGLGWLKADLENEETTRQLFQAFEEAVR